MSSASIPDCIENVRRFAYVANHSMWLYESSLSGLSEQQGCGSGCRRNSRPYKNEHSHLL
jgi:hypothetical protein